MKDVLPRNFILLLIAALLLSGCMVLNGYDPASGLVFQDDFTDPGSGWPVYEKPAGKAVYLDGNYRLEALAPSTHLVAPLPSDFRIPKDVRVTVEALSVSEQTADDNDYFGVICRYQDAFNYYFLVISQDGYYGIGKIKGGTAVLLNADQLLPVDAILRDGKNLLVAECAGDLLQISVNGVVLDSVQDSDWQSGGIGLIAASGERGNQVVEFDRLMVEVVR